MLWPWRPAAVSSRRSRITTWRASTSALRCARCHHYAALSTRLAWEVPRMAPSVRWDVRVPLGSPVMRTPPSWTNVWWRGHMRMPLAIAVGAAVGVVAHVVEVAGPPFAGDEAAPTMVAKRDRPALGRRPHRRARADVEGLTAAAEQVAHHPAVARQPPQGVGGEGAAVEELRLGPESVGHGVDVGHQLQGVAVRAGGSDSLLARPQQLDQGVGPPLGHRPGFT